MHETNIKHRTRPHALGTQWKEQLSPRDWRETMDPTRDLSLALNEWPFNREKMGGVSQADEQQIQRNREIPPKKLPSDLPLLHRTATAAAENRLDGII